MEPQPPESDKAVIPPEASEANGAQSSPRMLLRAAWGFAGVFLPFVCFAIGFPSGSLSAAHDVPRGAALLLSHHISLPLYPLLLTSIASLALLASRPARYKDNGWVRLGVFSGVVLSLEYWVVFQFAISGTLTVGAWSETASQFVFAAVVSGIAIALPWYFARMVMFVSDGIVNARESVLFGCAATVVIVVFLLGLVALVGSLPIAPDIVAALCLRWSTPWAVAAYISAAVWLTRRRKGRFLQFTLWQLFVATTWLAVHFAAWRTAIVMILARIK